MDSFLEERISKIEEYKRTYNSLCIQMLKADSGKFFSMDFLAIAAIRRSMSLSDAFSGLVAQRNYCCAAVVVRLQLDSCMRFFAPFMVDDPAFFCDEVLRGMPVRKMKDRSGQKMTDSYLVSLLAKEHPWVERVYKESSGFIHLSNKHIFAAFGRGHGAMDVSFSTSSVDEDVDLSLWNEMADAYLAATELLLNYLMGWAYTKENPELITNSKKKNDKTHAIEGDL